MKRSKFIIFNVLDLPILVRVVYFNHVDHRREDDEKKGKPERVIILP